MQSTVIQYKVMIDNSLSLSCSNTAVEARPRAKGNSIRPVSVFARTAAQNGNPRYMVSLCHFTLYVLN